MKASDASVGESAVSGSALSSVSEPERARPKILRRCELCNVELGDDYMETLTGRFICPQPEWQRCEDRTAVRRGK